MDSFLKYWPVLLALATVLWGWLMWSARSSFASKTDVSTALTAIAEQIDTLEKEQLKLVERMRTLPSSEDLNQVSNKLTELHGDHKALRAEMEGMNRAVETIDRSVTRIENFLLKGSKGER